VFSPPPKYSLMRSKDSASRQPGQIRRNSISAARDHALLATIATDAKKKKRRRDIGIRLRGIRSGDKPASATPAIGFTTKYTNYTKRIGSDLHSGSPNLLRDVRVVRVFRGFPLN
jgi:hypothetical protein